MPSDPLFEMLSFIFEKEIGFDPKKAKKLAGCFSDIDEFLTITKEQLINYPTASGKNKLFRFSEEDLDKIIAFSRSGYIISSLSIQQNYLNIICRVFTQTQLSMISNLKLINLIPNPFLIRGLNLSSPSEFITFNVYARVTRSIVTSMGFYTEKFIINSSNSVEKATKPWDVVKTKSDGSQYLIQLKSGPNDMDKDQMDKWAEYIKEAINQGNAAYIGISYGKRSDVTITMNHFASYLPDWEKRTLIGKELWNFVSDDPQYIDDVLNTALHASRIILSDRTFGQQINLAIERLVAEFIEIYGDGEQGISNYIHDVL